MLALGDLLPLLVASDVNSMALSLETLAAKEGGADKRLAAVAEAASAADASADGSASWLITCN